MSSDLPQQTKIPRQQFINPRRLLKLPSIFVPEHIVRRRDLRAGAKILWSLLYGSESQPHIPTLARKMGATDKQCARFLAELQRKGLL